MAHFAKINLNNKVIEVISINNNELLDSNGVEQETKGINFLRTLYNEPEAQWKQTSYNTLGGIHILGGTPFRKNHAGINYTYDEDKDAFISPKPFASWLLKETTYQWESPVAYPDDGKQYTWNEDTTSWDAV